MRHYGTAGCDANHKRPHHKHMDMKQQQQQQQPVNNENLCQMLVKNGTLPLARRGGRSDDRSDGRSDGRVRMRASVCSALLWQFGELLGAL